MPTARCSTRRRPSTNVETPGVPDAISAARSERAVTLPARPAAAAARSQPVGLASGVDGAGGRAIEVTGWRPAPIGDSFLPLRAGRCRAAQGRHLARHASRHLRRDFRCRQHAPPAYCSEDLGDAIEHGRDMAASASGGFLERTQRTACATPRRHRRLKKMTPKTVRRRMIRAHNRRLRAHLLREQRERAEQ